jgi:hypothetical protein
MLLLSRAAALVASVLAVSACGAEVIRNDPSDAAADGGAPTAARRLRFDDWSTLSLEPGERASLAVRVTDHEGRPVPADVRWSLLGESSDATLLTTRTSAIATPDGAYVASVTLQASTESAVFYVRASTDDGAEAMRAVSVSGRGFGGIRAEVAYDGVRAPNRFEVSLFTEGRCESIRSARPARSTIIPAQRGAHARFDALAADLQFAVVADGLGPTGERVSRGCVEGVRVSRDDEQSITIRPSDFDLHVEGRYDVRVQLGLDVVARSARALWLEAAAIPADEGRALLRAVADEVERSSGAESRAAFESAVEASLAAEVNADLRRRDALPSTRLAHWADSIAASLGGAVLTLDAEALVGESGTRLQLTRARATLDPRTPDDDSDDLERELVGVGRGTVTVLPGDRAMVVLERAPLPVSQLALAARDAYLVRSSSWHSTAERLRSEVRCSAIASLLRPYTARCETSCIVSACESALEAWAQRFDDALSERTSTLQSAHMTFVGVARAPGGSVTVRSIASSAVEGWFIEDPSRPVRGVGLLMRR